MKSAFTDYVRSLEPGSELYSPTFDAAWIKLRDALIGELKNRSLWSTPPYFLGVSAGGSWSEPEALEELLVDCFMSVFVQRLETLKALLEKMENIEGLVFRNIRNFLYDTQKRHNPLSFRVFEALRQAIRRLIEARTLYVLAGDPKVRNATVLGFEPWNDSADIASRDLTEQVRTWSDDLLPQLVTATPKQLEDVVERLCAHLESLEAQGVETFRFGDVVRPLKSDVRNRWHAIWQQLEGETVIEGGDEDLVRIARLARPDPGLEQRQAFKQLLSCMAEALPRLGKTRKTREHLQKLWSFLTCYATESDQDAMPSHRRLAEMLDIPRYRFPELYETLGFEVRKCRNVARQPLERVKEVMD